MDYAKLVSAKLDVMTTAEIGKFLVVCTLASDLYCSAYASGATLAKDSNLAKAARHYKVNGEKILRELKESFTEKTQKERSKSTPRSSAKLKRKGGRD